MSYFKPYVAGSTRNSLPILMSFSSSTDSVGSLLSKTLVIIAFSTLATIRLVDQKLMVLMGRISLSFTACIFALLFPFTSPTPLEKAPAGPLPQAPQVAPRDIVTVTRHVVESIVQSNPPYYDTACKVGGCTFSYEASNNTIHHTVPSSNKFEVGVSFLLAQRGTQHGLSFHTP